MIKKRVKGLLFNVQCHGDENDWEGANTPLYNVPGLPRQKTRDHLPRKLCRTMKKFSKLKIIFKSRSKCSTSVYFANLRDIDMGKKVTIKCSFLLKFYVF